MHVRPDFDSGGPMGRRVRALPPPDTRVIISTGAVARVGLRLGSYP